MGTGLAPGWQPPSGWSHAYFAERKHKFGESQAGTEILGMGPQAEISGLNLTFFHSLLGGVYPS